MEKKGLLLPVRHGKMREYILVGLMRALTQCVIGRWCVHKDMNCQVKG